MPYISHRRGAGRNFDCIYDPNYILPSERDSLHASSSTLLNSSRSNVYTHYDNMFEDVPPSKRIALQKQRKNLPPIYKLDKKFSNSSFCSGGSVGGLEECLEILPGVGRLQGGANNPAERRVYNIVTSPSECKIKPYGLEHFLPRPSVAVKSIKIDDDDADVELHKNSEDYRQCLMYNRALPKRKIIRTRGTQTRYRESSAQTLPYLPEVANKKSELEDMEIFQLPQIIKGEGPPGIYEVEMLERARKRWAFAKALKANFKRQLEEAREKSKHAENKHILEAFEWEKWMEREEYIQECQMMRLEMVIQMFDEREKEMHSASKTRLEISCEKIAARREAGLRKNEIEFGRQMRRLEIKRRNAPRNWRKENITKELGDPSSEFYAPQMRYGVSPSHRHYVGGRKAFEARMDDLEKKVVNMKHLVCPFAKLKEWSKPKGLLREVEQNFCTDENLKKLYESLTGLRKQSQKQKIVPKCLIEKLRIQPKSIPSTMSEGFNFVKLSVMREEEVSTKSDGDYATKLREELFEEEQVKLRQSFKILKLSFERKRDQLEYVQNEQRQEDLETLLDSYEGSTLGWLFRFLTEEMERLQELRKLHFLTMIAQKERWRREAAEAGLRQKENNLRKIYEQLYNDTLEANTEVTEQYLNEILQVDTRVFADEEATKTVTKLAKLVDADIQRWLDSFQTIQHPLNYDTLRQTLKDIIFPDTEVLAKRHESKMIAEYIVEDVIYPNMLEVLEPYDISFSIASVMVDRLIDNDLYLMSSEESSECDCPTKTCRDKVAQCEAEALLRKLIRRATPGRRWRTHPECIVDETVNDFLDDVIQAVENKMQFEEKHREVSYSEKLLIADRSVLDFFRKGGNTLDNTYNVRYGTRSSTDLEQFIRTQILQQFRDLPDKFTIKKILSNKDVLIEVDSTLVPQYESASQVSRYGNYVCDWRTKRCQPIDLKGVRSVFHMDKEDLMSSPGDQTTSESSFSELGAILGSSGTKKVINKKFTNRLLKKMLNTFVPAEIGDSEDSTYDDDDDESGEEQNENLLAESKVAEWEVMKYEAKDIAMDAITFVLKQIFGNFSEDKIKDDEDSIIGMAENEEENDILYDEFNKQENEDQEEEGDEEDRYVLTINESQLEFMNSTECKCRQELEYEEYVRELLREGKVKIIRKPKPIVKEQEILSDSDVMGSVRTFQYDNTSTDEYELEEEHNIEAEVVPLLPKISHTSQKSANRTKVFTITDDVEIREIEGNDPDPEQKPEAHSGSDVSLFD